MGGKQGAGSPNPPQGDGNPSTRRRVLPNRTLEGSRGPAHAASDQPSEGRVRILIASAWSTAWRRPLTSSFW